MAATGWLRKCGSDGPDGVRMALRDASVKTESFAAEAGHNDCPCTFRCPSAARLSEAAALRQGFGGAA